MEGQQIKEIRKTLGLTQEQLAQVLGVTKTTVGRYEINLAKPAGDAEKKLAQLSNVCKDTEQLDVIKDLITSKKSDGVAALASTLSLGAALLSLAGIVAGGIGILPLLKGSAGAALYHLLGKYQKKEKD